jgi:hypothetical protein
MIIECISITADYVEGWLPKTPFDLLEKILIPPTPLESRGQEVGVFGEAGGGAGKTTRAQLCEHGWGGGVTGPLLFLIVGS